jgi:hypothetical protein
MQIPVACPRYRYCRKCAVTGKIINRDRHQLVNVQYDQNISETDLMPNTPLLQAQNLASGELLTDVTQP